MLIFDSDINVEGAATLQPTGLCFIEHYSSFSTTMLGIENSLTYIRLFHVLHIAVSTHYMQQPSYLSSFKYTTKLTAIPNS